MREDDPSAQAFAICENIALERARRTTKPGAYSDGYRSAAEDIARAVSRRRCGREPTPLERDLREAEIEAHTLARVVAVGHRVVIEAGLDSDAALGIRKVFSAFFDDDDLPPALRRHRSASDNKPPESSKLRRPWTSALHAADAESGIALIERHSRSQSASSSGGSRPIQRESLRIANDTLGDDT